MLDLHDNATAKHRETHVSLALVDRELSSVSITS